MKRDWAAIAILALLAVSAYREDHHGATMPLACFASDGTPLATYGDLLILPHGGTVKCDCAAGQCIVNDHGR